MLSFRTKEEKLKYCEIADVLSSTKEPLKLKLNVCQ